MPEQRIDLKRRLTKAQQSSLKECQKAANQCFTILDRLCGRKLAVAIRSERLHDIGLKKLEAETALQQDFPEKAGREWFEVCEMCLDSLRDAKKALLRGLLVRPKYVDQAAEWAEKARLASKELVGLDTMLHDTCHAVIDTLFPAGAGTRRAMALRTAASGRIHVLFFSHEATRTGAPLALLNLIDHLNESNTIVPWVVIDSVDKIGENFLDIAPTISTADLRSIYGDRDASLAALAEWFAAFPSEKIAVCNTVATLHFGPIMKKHRVPVMAWIHELPTVITQWVGGNQKMHALAQSIDCIAYNSEMVRLRNNEAFSIETERTCVVPLGIDHGMRSHHVSTIGGDPLMRFGVPAGAPVVIACGTFELRKGIDLFAQVAHELIRLLDEGMPESSLPHFVWLGLKQDFGLNLWIQHDVDRLGLGDRVHFVGQQNNPQDFFRRASLFLLLSREEPVGLAALEALQNGVPVLGFEGAGGILDYCRAGVTLSPYLDVLDMAKNAANLLRNSKPGPGAIQGTEDIGKNFRWEKSAAIFLEHVHRTAKSLGASAGSIVSSRRQHDVIIVSLGPPPVFPDGSVEGGGLRCWGLAKGLRAQLPDHRIAVAYSENFRGANRDLTRDGIHVTTWRDGELPSLVASAKTVIASYCMGEISVGISKAMEDDQILVLDCYVPIYVEVSARKSGDLGREQTAFERDMASWNKALPRGDIYLCANAPQRSFYTGVLSALGRLSPKTYGQDPIMEVPFGIYRDQPVATDTPCSNLVGREGTRKVMWFGGIYPWFDLRNLMEAVAMMNQDHPTALIVVGASNPFVNHPDFVARYEQTILHASQPHLKNLVHFHPWIPFHERANWYLDADITVLINDIGVENEYAWRTRLVDYLWGGMLIATNGGDPLSERLFQRGAAVKLNGLTPTALAADLRGALEDKDAADRVRENLSSLKEEFFWDKVVAPLAERIAPSEGISSDLLSSESSSPQSI